MSDAFYRLYGALQQDYADADEKTRRLADKPYTDDEISFMRFQSAAQQENDRRIDSFNRYDSNDYASEMENAWKADGRGVYTKSGLVKNEEDLSDELRGPDRERLEDPIKFLFCSHVG